MRTVPEIIDAIGGSSSFARRIGKNPSTVSEMKRSGSIPVRYWPDVIAAGVATKIKITNDMLVAAHLMAKKP